MEFENVLKLRRSTRSFTDQQISNEELQKLLTAAQAAPQAGGDYARIHITVVQNPQIAGKLRKACMTLSRKTGEMMDAFYGAPTLIFLSAAGVSDDYIEYCDVACIIENILLQAVDLGLGAVYIWGCLNSLRANEEAVKLLDLPEGHVLLSASAVGHPTKPPEVREPHGGISITLL